MTDGQIDKLGRITFDKVMVLKLCTFSDEYLLMYQCSFNSLLYGSNFVNTGEGLRFLHSAISLVAVYQCNKFHNITFNTFIDMLRTKV